MVPGLRPVMWMGMGGVICFLAVWAGEVRCTAIGAIGSSRTSRAMQISGLVRNWMRRGWRWRIWMGTVILIWWSIRWGRGRFAFGMRGADDLGLRRWC